MKSSLALEGRAYREFVSDIKSPETRKTYTVHLRAFMQWAGVDSADKLLTLGDSKFIQEKARDHLLDIKDKGSSHAARLIRYSAIHKFYKNNDVAINWEKVYSVIGEAERVVEDRPYTLAEIKKVVEKAELREKIAILLMATAGLRVGAVPLLRKRDLMPMPDYGLYAIHVYPKSKKYEYWTFCSPECARYIDDYFQERERYGEKLTPDSPIIREQFNKRDDKKSPFARQISKGTIIRLVDYLLEESGVREARPRIAGKKVNPRRDVMANHGFRKFFDTTLENNGANPVIVEKLMGHDIGLKGRYFKPPIDVLLREYLKGANELIINDENRLRIKVEHLEKAVSEAAPKEVVAQVLMQNKALMERQERLEQELKDQKDYMHRKSAGKTKEE